VTQQVRDAEEGGAGPSSGSPQTQRPTTAQALIRFLAAQRIERDGVDSGSSPAASGRTVELAQSALR